LRPFRTRGSDETKNPDGFPEIETDRLVLREITMDDLDWYFRHFSLPEVVEPMGFERLKDLDAAREELEASILGEYKEGKGLRWGITLKGSTKLIGSCGYYRWEHDPHRRIEIGYDLDPPYRRQGIMKEALAAIIDYGFDNMGVNRIALFVFSFNKPSIALARSLGFVREGTLRENSFHKGRFEDDEYFALLRSDWEEVRATKG
jgi:ribosomal-protein-alanine N-acetyltransferase